MDIPCIV